MSECAVIKGDVNVSSRRNIEVNSFNPACTDNFLYLCLTNALISGCIYMRAILFENIL